MRSPFFVRSIVLCAATVATFSAYGQPSRSDRFGVLARVAEISPFESRERTLTEGLRLFGKSMRERYINFAIELQPGATGEPRVVTGYPRGATLGDALESIVRQAPDYDFEVVSEHLVSVFPRSTRNDPRNLMNVKVARFDVENVQSGMILSWPDFYIPELREMFHGEPPGVPATLHIFSGSVAVGPLVSIHLKGATVRDILNAVSVATEGTGGDAFPLGWEYSGRPPQSGETLSPWRLLVSVPGDWKALRNRSVGAIR